MNVEDNNPNRSLFRVRITAQVHTTVKHSSSLEDLLCDQVPLTKVPPLLYFQMHM